MRSNAWRLPLIGITASVIYALSLTGALSQEPQFDRLPSELFPGLLNSGPVDANSRSGIQLPIVSFCNGRNCYQATSAKTVLEATLDNFAAQLAKQRKADQDLLVKERERYAEHIEKLGKRIDTLEKRLEEMTTRLDKR